MSFGPTRQRRTSIFVGAWFQILDPPQADLRFTTTKSDLSRREVPLCGQTRPAAPVSAKPRFSGGEDGILNQNPIFEMASSLTTQFNTTYAAAVKPYPSFPLDPFHLTGYFDFKPRI